MQFYTSSQAINRLNEWGEHGTPFFFFVNYAGTQWYVAPLNAVDSRILYRMPRHSNYSDPSCILPSSYTPHKLIAPPITDYARGFDIVQEAISRGETRLINLTWRVPFESDFDQHTRFQLGREKYMLMVEGMFSVFSPEPFIEIEDGRIATFPMKGTISTSIPNAEAVLLSNDKEAKEHADSVSLLTEELERVATDVETVRYRYCETIADGRVIQTSSEIAGRVKEQLQGRYGDIIATLLPGGSIAGAPKEASLEVIARAEAYERGFYTGIFGVFDGKRLDTSVMIRFLQYADDGQTYFFGGGGITSNSILENEYNELLLKAHATILY